MWEKMLDPHMPPQFSFAEHSKARNNTTDRVWSEIFIAFHLMFASFLLFSFYLFYFFFQSYVLYTIVPYYFLYFFVVVKT